MANNLGDLQDSGTLYPVTTQKVSGAVTNSTAVTLTASNAGIVVGQVVTGSGIQNADGINPATTVVTYGGSTTLTLSRPANLVDGAVLNFAGTQNSNIVTDLVWGNFPIQPNDDRATTAAGNFAATGLSATTVSAASSTGKITTFTTTAAHGISVGQYVSTGIYAVGGTVAAPVAGTTVSAQTGSAATVTLAAATPTADTTQGTVTLATSAPHNISVGELVTITGGLTTAAVYNGVFTALAGTTGSTLVVANATAAVASPAATTTACSVAVNHFDVNNVLVLSVPTTTSFTVAQSLPNIGSVNPTGKTASLEVVSDASWNILNGSYQTSATTKVQSARLNTGSLTSTLNGNSYVTPAMDGVIVDSGFAGYPAYNTGKFKATAAAVGSKTGSAYIYVTCPNNLSDFITIGTTTVTITGFTTAGLNVTAATVVSATPDGFVVAGTNALLGTSVTGQNALVQVVGWGISNHAVTAVTVDSTTNTTYKYTAQNYLQVGDVVTVTGLVSNATLNPNVSSVTVAAATATSFTVTGQTASTAGYAITGQIGKVEYTNALANLDGAYSAGTFGYLVPNVLGQTATNAVDAFVDRGIVLTATTATTAVSKTAQGVWRTAGSAIVQINTSATHGLLAGDVFTAASNTGVADGDYTVLYVIDTTNFLFVSASTAVQTTASGGTGTVIGKVGTVHITTPAGNTRTTTATATYSLWA
jgi:hypothetical protein